MMIPREALLIDARDAEIMPQVPERHTGVRIDDR
jgi:hypothetical protein